MARKGTVPAVCGALMWLAAGRVDAQTSRAVLLARGFNLPKQWGLGVTWYSQRQPYSIKTLSLGIQGIDPSVASTLGVDNRTKTVHAVLDYWLLPFLDVEVLAGKLNGTTNVKVSKLQLGVPLDDITVRYDGLVYGGGFTLAAGGDRYFATLTGEFTSTHLDVVDSSVKAWVLTPKVGMTVGNGALYLGAMYQDPQEKHKGTYAVPYLGTVPYAVTLGSEHAWSYLAGVNAGFGEHWVLTLESGFGDRHSTLAYLDYRW